MVELFCFNYNDRSLHARKVSWSNFHGLNGWHTKAKECSEETDCLISTDETALQPLCPRGNRIIK